MPACPTCGAANPPGARFCNACGSKLDVATTAAAERDAERRIVTMLFCDVRGSTAMAETLDPEEWTDLMNAAYEQLIAPVYRYEGTVARLMGDAILAFFGAPTAHEDDPQRAVKAGLEIVEGIGPLRARLADERGLDLNIRVGINTGPVVVGDVGSELRQEYSAMGDAVNVAARMEQTADPGTVRITEDTYRLVADLFEVEELGEVAVKGKRRPVRSYRVVARLAAPWRVRATRSLDAPLVGRERELAAVASALEDLETGRGSILLISGEPGMGKSRLVAETNARWSERHPADDRPWDFWACVPYDTMQPYAQYRRLIRERTGTSETDPAEFVRAKIADFMKVAPPGWEERSERVARALLGVEHDDEERLEGEAFQRAAVDLVVGSTVALGPGRLLVFEDLHWCDHASLELVHATAGLVATVPILILITFRPDRQAPSWAFRERIEDDFGDHTIALELAQLTPDQCGRLIDELLPVEGIVSEVRGRLVGRTEGNPFFVQEVARALIDRGVVERHEAGWRVTGDVADVAIPDSVQSLITAGLDRLPPEPRRTLQAAAVIGRAFDVELLRGAVDADPGPDLRVLQERDLIRPTAHPGGFVFRHALTQEAAYGTLLKRRRRELHRRVAEVIEATADRPEEAAVLLAGHFAEAGDDEATLRYTVVAGDAAARLYANEEAEAQYRTALDFAGRVGADTALVRSLYERRGSALELAGRYDDAIANYEEMHAEARAHGDEPMELAANTAISLLYATATPKFDPERGRRMSEENVVTARRLGDRRAEARALWNIVVANVYGGGDAERAVEAGEASLAIARELADREQLAFTLNDVCRAYMAVGDFATAADRLHEARRLWEQLDNRPMLGDNLATGSAMLMMNGEYAAALDQARLAESVSESVGSAWGRSVATMTVYRVELASGALGAAVESMRRCREFGEQGAFAFAEIGTRSDLAWLLAYVGEGARALQLADEALSIARERMPPAVSASQVARAEAFLALGKRDDARDALDQVDVEMFPEPERTLLLASTSIARSRLALADGDPDGAAEIARTLLRELGRIGVRHPVTEARVALATALIASARNDDAELELDETIEGAEQLGERTALWEALALAAGLRERRGAEAEAAELRRRSLAIVDGIAAGLPDDLTSSFLAREDVIALRR
ncbi:MAG TPA: adenylate/guanylate cyclase domain-containing protein [Actinomycetota bacterium]|nr:adenylate/guanylate cyclase domain-containing protein [Actinomycetota bacterium]